MTRRNVASAALWYALGALTVLLLSYYTTRAQATIRWSSELPAPAGSKIKGPAVNLDYTVPGYMKVGDTGDIRMHITDLHLYARVKSTKQEVPVPANVILTTSKNCTATETTSFPGATYVLGGIGVPSALDWNLTATAPGDCTLTFKSIFVGQLSKIDTITVPISERVSVATEMSFAAALIALVSALVGLVAKLLELVARKT